MRTEWKLADEMDRTTYDFLLHNLEGITDEELDWLPHPEANSARWILGHLLWFEEWASDAIEGTGRYLTDRSPTAVDVPSFDEARRRFDEARERYRRLMGALSEDDAARTIDYFGMFEVSLGHLAQMHALHLSGHQYQIRYIRGTYSRAHGTDKGIFDPW